MQLGAEADDVVVGVVMVVVVDRRLGADLSPNCYDMTDVYVEAFLFVDPVAAGAADFGLNGGVVV